MIRINVQSPDILARNKMIADAANALRARSYTERNPHLGKMINCHVCGNRHYSSKVCELKYATHDQDGIPYNDDESPAIVPNYHPDLGYFLPKAYFGAAAFAKKRILPHRHPVVLEVLNLTNVRQAELEAQGGSEWVPDITIAVRRAMETVKKRFKAAAHKKRRQQDISRRINHGLEKPGTRV